MSGDMLPLVDETGRVIGTAPRAACHGDKSLLHPVVHCIILNHAGDWLLQKRGLHKDVQPGRWDTAVGGHVDPGETVEAALLREIHEEVGLRVALADCAFLHRYIMESDVERELVHTWRLLHDGPFRHAPDEIDALRFWSTGEIRDCLGQGVFTPNFEDEFCRFPGLVTTPGRIGQNAETGRKTRPGRPSERP